MLRPSLYVLGFPNSVFLSFFPIFPFFLFYMFRLVSFRFFSSNTLAYLDKEHDHLNTRGTKLGSNIRVTSNATLFSLAFAFPRAVSRVVRGS